MTAASEPVMANAVVHSRWLGDLVADPRAANCSFPGEYRGFEDERRMLPVEIPSQRPLVYLQKPWPTRKRAACGAAGIRH